MRSHTRAHKAVNGTLNFTSAQACNDCDAINTREKFIAVYCRDGSVRWPAKNKKEKEEGPLDPSSLHCVQLCLALRNEKIIK